MKMPSFIPLMTRVTVVSALLFATACHKDLSLSDDNLKGNSSVHIFLTDDPSLVAEHLFLDIRKLEIKVEDNDLGDDHGRHNGSDDNTADNSHGRDDPRGHNAGDDKGRKHGNDDKKTADNSHGSDDGVSHDAWDDHGSDTAGGWTAVNINAGVYDILRFRNGLDTLFATGSFPSTHRLRRVRITLGDNNSAVIDGSKVDLDVSEHDRYLVIDIDEDRVEIKNGGRTDLWIDIDAGQSLVKNGDRFQLKPQAKSFSKNKSGRIEGSVLPAAAKVVVMAINGTDTATARPEDEGEFKFIGLKAGAYRIVYHATKGGYQDKVVPNVVISGKEDVHLPAVTLHQ